MYCIVETNNKIFKKGLVQKKNLVFAGLQHWFPHTCFKTSASGWREDLICTICQCLSCKWFHDSGAISIYSCDITESRVGKRRSRSALRSHTGVARSSTEMNCGTYSKVGNKVWRKSQERKKTNTMYEKWREKQWRNFLRRRDRVKKRWMKLGQE